MAARKITFKKTSSASVTRYGTKGVLGRTPASYDILADGEKVGTITGGCHSRLACKSGYQTARVKGKTLRYAGVRGDERTRMIEEINEVLDSLGK